MTSSPSIPCAREHVEDRRDQVGQPPALVVGRDDDGEGWRGGVRGFAQDVGSAAPPNGATSDCRLPAVRGDHCFLSTEARRRHGERPHARSCSARSWRWRLCAARRRAARRAATRGCTRTSVSASSPASCRTGTRGTRSPRPSTSRTPRCRPCGPTCGSSRPPTGSWRWSPRRRSFRSGATFGVRGRRHRGGPAVPRRSPIPCSAGSAGCASARSARCSSPRSSRSPCSPRGRRVADRAPARRGWAARRRASAIGLAFTFKYNAATYGLPALLALCLRRGARAGAWQAAAALAAGAALPPLAMLAVFAAGGARSTTSYHATYTYNLLYSGETYRGAWHFLSYLVTFPVRLLVDRLAVVARRARVGGAGAVVVPRRRACWWRPRGWRRRAVDRDQRQPWTAAVLRAGLAGPRARRRASASPCLAAASRSCRAWSSSSLVATGIWRVTPLPKAVDYWWHDVQVHLRATCRATTYLARFGGPRHGRQVLGTGDRRVGGLPLDAHASVDRVLVFGFSPCGAGGWAPRQRDPLLLEPAGDRRLPRGRAGLRRHRDAAGARAHATRRSSCSSVTTGIRMARTPGRSS